MKDPGAPSARDPKLVGLSGPVEGGAWSEVWRGDRAPRFLAPRRPPRLSGAADLQRRTEGSSVSRGRVTHGGRPSLRAEPTPFSRGVIAVFASAPPGERGLRWVKNPLQEMRPGLFLVTSQR